MTNPNDVEAMIGRTAVDSDGSKVGKVGQVYLDDQTQQPVWVTVHTGMFGTKETFAPLYGARVDGDQLVLGVSKDLVKDAPSVEADGHLEDDENDRLYAHYADYFGTGGQTTYSDTDYSDTDHSDDVASDSGAEGYDTSGTASDATTDDAMTRSEERLHVGTEKVESGRARLRKYVVTEMVTKTVPVSHEEVRLEREPITDANRDAALSGQDISEDEHEVILHSEEPVVSKETVPVERVRLATETVTEEHEVNEEIRKEQIDQEPEIVTSTDTR